MKKLMQTPSQTVGPFFAYGLVPEQYNYDFKSLFDGDMTAQNTEGGEKITIIGQVIDGQGNVIPDVLIEFWQADRKAFGRVGTGSDKTLTFKFQAIKPQNTEGVAQHINITIFMRGLLVHTYTRLYFSDEAIFNAQDPVLKSVPKDRRHTLIAERQVINGEIVYKFNIYMQGDNETVFFDV